MRQPKETLKKLVTVESLLSALEPPMSAIVELEKKVAALQLQLAALEGRVEQVTRQLEIRGEHSQPARAAPLAGVKTA